MDINKFSEGYLVAGGPAQNSLSPQRGDEPHNFPLSMKDRICSTEAVGECGF